MSKYKIQRCTRGFWRYRVVAPDGKWLWVKDYFWTLRGAQRWIDRRTWKDAE